MAIMTYIALWRQPQRGCSLSARRGRPSSTWPSLGRHGGNATGEARQDTRQDTVQASQR